MPEDPTAPTRKLYLKYHEDRSSASSDAVHTNFFLIAQTKI